MLDNYITDHGVELPDPAVCFDDEGYKPSKNDYTQINDTMLLKALREFRYKFIFFRCQ